MEGQVIRTWLPQAVGVFESKVQIRSDDLHSEKASFPEVGGWLHISWFASRKIWSCKISKLNHDDDFNSWIVVSTLSGHTSCTTSYGWQGVRSNWGLLQKHHSALTLDV